MKKILSIILSGMLVLAMLAGCSDSGTQSVPEQETSETEITVEPNSVPETSEAVSAATDPFPAMTAILNDISANYWPGTAGCSLSAAIKAAALLDWYAKNQPEPDAIASAVQGWFGNLTEEDKTLFAQQISDIYYAAKELGGENAAGLMETAGITSDSYPWQEGAAKTLFGAIYTGVGMDLPEDSDESYRSELGYSLVYDPSCFSAENDHFQAIENSEPLNGTYFAVQGYPDSSAAELQSGLVLQSGVDDAKQSTSYMGTGAYPVLTVSYTKDGAEYRFFVYDTGTTRLLFEYSFAAGNTEWSDRLDTMLSTVTIETAK
jgi:hypothetical protein